MNTKTRRARLVALHRLDRSAASAEVATRDLVALHASDPLTPHLALQARVPGYRVGDLDPSALWRGHAMRRTLWVATNDEVGMLDGAVGQTIARRERKRLVGWAEGKEDWLASLEKRALAAVLKRPGIGTRELNTLVPELATKITVGSGKWVTQTAIGSRLLFVLAMELKLQRTASTGSWRSSQYGWVITGAVSPVDPVAARALLVGRYLARFGPVTTVDVKWWTGLTVAQTKKALAAAGAVEVALDVGTGWMPPDWRPLAAQGLAFLPGLDPTPMGYKERDWFLGEHGPRLFDRNGNIGPSIWEDGRIVGGWAVLEGRVVTTLLEATDETAIAAEAAALSVWLAGTTITPRFRTPLEKALTATGA